MKNLIQFRFIITAIIIPICVCTSLYLFVFGQREHKINKLISMVMYETAGFMTDKIEMQMKKIKLYSENVKPISNINIDSLEFGIEKNKENFKYHISPKYINNIHTDIDKEIDCIFINSLPQKYDLELFNYVSYCTGINMQIIEHLNYLETNYGINDFFPAIAMKTNCMASPNKVEGIIFPVLFNSNLKIKKMYLEEQAGQIENGIGRVSVVNKYDEEKIFPLRIIVQDAVSNNEKVYFREHRVIFCN